MTPAPSRHDCRTPVMWWKHVVLSNALRHTPAGGQVTIEAEDEGDHAKIQVVDDGDGIAAEELDLIFERFYRGDPSRSATDGPTGSGLGLTIARAIIAAHEGTITAASAGPGHGATVTIRLPHRPAEAEWSTPDELQPNRATASPC